MGPATLATEVIFRLRATLYARDLPNSGWETFERLEKSHKPRTTLRRILETTSGQPQHAGSTMRAYTFH